MKVVACLALLFVVGCSSSDPTPATEDVSRLFCPRTAEDGSRYYVSCEEP